MLLSLVPGAFAWLMHSDMLDLIWARLAVVPVHNLPAAMKSGSLFWIVSFICPAVLLMAVGVEVLVWNESTYAVAISFSVGVIYCIYQLYRVLNKIGSVGGEQAPSHGPNNV